MFRIKLFVALVMLSYVNASWAATDVWPFPKFCNNVNGLDTVARCLCSNDKGFIADDTDGAFTIDLRRNIGASQWKNETPYKYILKMYVHGDGGVEMPHCTANMVGGKIVTARHCLIKKGSGAKGLYYFKTADGMELSARVVASGNWNEGAIRSDGDWAVLDVVDGAGKQVVMNSGTELVKVLQSGKYADAILPGFGGLKVMSDEEIQRLQKAFAYYLQTMGGGANGGNGIVTGSMAGSKFMEDLYVNQFCRNWFNDPQKRHYYDERCLDANGKYKFSGLNYAACGIDHDDIFRDTEQMKLSTGRFSVSGGQYTMDTQAWGGNSGGGVYIKPDWSLVGLAHKTSKDMVVGGARHANADSAMAVTSVGNFQDLLSINGGDVNDDDGQQNNSVGNNDNGKGGILSDNDGDDGSDVPQNKGVNNSDNGVEGSRTSRVAGSACMNEDLPEYATAGVYRMEINGDFDCGGRRCNCDATACVKGYRVHVGRCKANVGSITIY